MEKINIAELLKDCPTGTKLYSPLCGECYFDRLNMGTIICKKQNTQEITFTSEGYYMLPVFDDCECVLFPSKENRDWSKWGNIILNHTRKILESNPYSGVSFKYNGHTWGMRARDNGVEILVDREIKERVFLDNKLQGKSAFEVWKDMRLEVYQQAGGNRNEPNCSDDTTKMFSLNDIDEIFEKIAESCESESYLWTIQDAKDGDILAFDDNTIVIFKDLYNKTTFHTYCHIEDGVFSVSKFDCPDWWDIKFKPATKEQSDFLFQKIKEAGYKWDEETKTLEKLPKFKVGDKITDRNKFIYRITEITDKGYKLHDLKNTFITFEEADLYFVKVVDVFDITTLKPFDWVLVRDRNDEKWGINLFGYYNKSENQYYCIGFNDIGWDKCIPYEANKELLGTTNDCDEFYKTW